MNSQKTCQKSMFNLSDKGTKVSRWNRQRDKNSNILTLFGTLEKTQGQIRTFKEVHIQCFKWSQYFSWPKKTLGSQSSLRNYLRWRALQELGRIRNYMEKKIILECTNLCPRLRYHLCIQLRVTELWSNLIWPWLSTYSLSINCEMSTYCNSVWYMFMCGPEQMTIYRPGQRQDVTCIGRCCSDRKKCSLQVLSPCLCPRFLATWTVSPSKFIPRIEYPGDIWSFNNQFQSWYCNIFWSSKSIRKNPHATTAKGVPVTQEI